MSVNSSTSLAAERLEETRRETTRDAIARIDDDLHRAHRLHVRHDAVEIHLRYVELGVAAFARAEVVIDDALIQALNLLAVNGRAAQDHLEAVVVGRIVAARYDDARIHAPLARWKRQRHARREIADGRGHHADIDHVDARFAQAVRERADEFGTGEPTIARDDDRIAALLADLAAERAADALRDIAIDRLADDPANVIRLENGLGYLAHEMATSSVLIDEFSAMQP